MATSIAKESTTMKRIICITAALLLMPGCRWSRKSISSTINQQQATYEKLPAMTTLREPKAPITLNQPKLTLKQAVTFAVEHNPTLQAFLENLGVSQAELWEAGLYSNPDVDLAVRTAKDAPGHNVEFETLTSISDLWQVPLRRRMAEHEYYAIQHAVISRVLDTAHKAKQAYINCLYTRKDKNLVYTIYQESKDLRDQIYKRYEHGYHTDLDLHLADTTVDRWYMAYQRAKAVEEEAYTELENVLGVSTGATKDIMLDHTFTINSIHPPNDRETLIEQAHVHRPELQEITSRINQYQSQIRFEQSRVFPRVDFGASFEQELSGKHIRGPAVSLEVPICNANQARISQAEYLKRRTQKEFQSMQTGIASEVALAYHELIALQEILERYQSSTLQSLNQAQSFATYYAQQKRLSVPTMLQTRLFLFETQREHLSIMHEAWNQIFRLERAIGMEIRDSILS